MKVFISQLMKNRSDEEILNERNRAIELLKNNNSNIEILDSYFEDYNPEGGSIPLKYLSKSIEILADADVLLCIGDWKSARGCRIEHECAKEYGIEVIYWNDIFENSELEIRYALDNLYKERRRINFKKMKLIATIDDKDRLKEVNNEIYIKEKILEDFFLKKSN